MRKKRREVTVNEPFYLFIYFFKEFHFPSDTHLVINYHVNRKQLILSRKTKVKQKKMRSFMNLLFNDNQSITINMYRFRFNFKITHSIGL